MRCIGINSTSRIIPCGTRSSRCLIVKTGKSPRRDGSGKGHKMTTWRSGKGSRYYYNRIPVYDPEAALPSAFGDGLCPRPVVLKGYCGSRVKRDRGLWSVESLCQSGNHFPEGLQLAYRVLLIHYYRGQDQSRGHGQYFIRLSDGLLSAAAIQLAVANDGLHHLKVCVNKACACPAE